MITAVLHTLRSRAPQLATIAVLIILSAGHAFMNNLANGNLVAGFAYPVLVAVIVVTVLRPDAGFFILLGTVLLLDHFGWVGELTNSFGYFVNLNVNPLFQIGASVSPFELHIALVLLAWIVTMVSRRENRVVPLMNGWAALTALGWILLVAGLSLATGGDVFVVLWEVRGLLYLFLFFFFAPQMLRTKRQLEIFFWVVIGTQAVKALQGFMRFAGGGFSFAVRDSYMTTEDTVLVISLVAFFVTHRIFCENSIQRKVLRASLPLIIVAWFGANRRSTYVSLMVSMMALLFFVTPERRRTIFKATSIGVVLFAIYLGVFWNASGTLGLPAQQIKSIIFPDDPTMMSARNYSSNLARRIENYNVSYTIRIYPIAGMGFGKPFFRPLHGFDAFGLSEYIPHNAMLWFFMRTGIIGGMLLLFFFYSHLVRAGRMIGELRDPYLRVMGAMSLLTVLTTLVVCHVEMHFHIYRNMIMLGTWMGILSVLPSADEDVAHEATTQA